MISYKEFCEERETLRLRYRDTLAAQTLDNSNRGSSVWPAFRAMGDLFVGSNETVRQLWTLAYRNQRSRDAHMGRIYGQMLNAWLPSYVELLTKPRKIDELLGRTS